ncbi:hypothetical protein [Pseudorhodoferax soli]|uniref:hypothetical protein n=1 Tax=Pseudorhodoferax soli TaxID=545864 RepID=UPI001B885FB8|nr:hypothetical protein [Pseudorhodoferax soli]
MAHATNETKLRADCNLAVTSPLDTAAHEVGPQQENPVPLTTLGNASGDHSDSAQRAVRQGWLRWLWSRRDGRLEDIRRLMLAQLATVAHAEQRANLAVRIKSAAGPEALWALRGDWMAALADHEGLLLARQRMSDVSFMFSGLLDREEHARTGLEVLRTDIPRGLVRNAAQMRADH